MLKKCNNQNRGVGGKGIVFMLVLVSLLALSLVGVSALTFDYPATGTTVSGNVTVNLTIGTGGDNYLNATYSFQCTSPLTGATMRFAPAATNLSASTLSFNNTLTQAKWGADCIGTLSAVVANGTPSANKTYSSTGIVVDNTAVNESYDSITPTSSDSIPLDSGTIGITTSESVLGATLHIAGGSYTMSGSNTSFSYAFSKTSQTIPEGIWTGYYVSVDGTGAKDTAVSSGHNLYVKYSNGNAVVIQQAQEQEAAQQATTTSNTNNGIWLILAAAGAGYFFFFSKGGR